MLGHQHRPIAGDPLLLAVLVEAEHHEDLLAVIDAQIHAGVGQTVDLLVSHLDVVSAEKCQLDGFTQSFLRLSTGLKQQAEDQQWKVSHLCVSLSKVEQG